MKLKHYFFKTIIQTYNDKELEINLRNQEINQRKKSKKIMIIFFLKTQPLIQLNELIN